METPTTVKIINSGNDKFSDEFIAYFLCMGYNVVPVDCNNEAILKHDFIRWDSNSIKIHSEFVVTNEAVIFTVNHTGLLYVFLFDDSYEIENDYDVQELCEFIIGTWGTIRGDRYKYNSHVIKMTEELINDWRVL